MAKLTPILCAICLALSGCASSVESWFGRTIRQDRFLSQDEDNKVVLVSGDYRVIRVMADRTSPVTPEGGREHYLICAETQADAIAARGASSTLKLSGEEAGDAVTETLTLTTTRTAVSDLVRQLGWQLCNARLNGDMTGAEYKTAVEALVDRAFRAITVPPK